MTHDIYDTFSCTKLFFAFAAQKFGDSKIIHYLCSVVIALQAKTMERDIFTSKPLRISGLKLIGGGKTLNISVLRTSLISLFFSFIVSFLCLACSKETSRSSYPEMQAYYVESCHLTEVAEDSVIRFSQKVNAFVLQHADAMDDPLYPKIRENIKAVKVKSGFYVNPEWDEEVNVNF